MLDVSRHLWWPHMLKDIVSMAEEFRSCTRYGKNVKYILYQKMRQNPSTAYAAGARVAIRLCGSLRR